MTRPTPGNGLIVFLALMLAPLGAHAAERWPIGITGSGAFIEALEVPGASASSPTVLLVGGVDGSEQSTQAVRGSLAAFEARPQDQRPFRLLVIPAANPDRAVLQFPPTGVAYREHIESHVLWRWIGTQAPDLVLVAGPDAGLADALSQNVVAGVGSIPARRGESGTDILNAVAAPIEPSSARREIERRAARSPRELATELAQVYGRQFPQPNYIAAMALIARIRLGQLDDVATLVGPYLDGSRDSFAKPSQSSLASHMLFVEWARRTSDERAAALVRRAAASGFTESGDLREFMPLHGGWSDSLFMDVPILAQAGALTGDRRFFDMAARHVTFMQSIVLRPDGLYRHQASADAAWGRGNAFAALGLALALSEFPADHPDYDRLRTSFRQHMAALARHQDEHGMWRNVIDRPGAYPEYSATAMITAAMVRGIRRGVLDASTYQPLVDRAWLAVLRRTGSDGSLVDVCESTGTRGLTDDDYLRRAALMGRDDRGGGMAMFLATELAGM